MQSSWFPPCSTRSLADLGIERNSKTAENIATREQYQFSVSYMENQGKIRQESFQSS